MIGSRRVSPWWPRTPALAAAMSLASLLAVSCGVPSGPGGRGDSGAEAEPGRAGPEQMHVTRFTIAEGEQRRVSANLEIIASEGIEIAGDLMVDPGDGGDIVLIAEDGDIVISGRIIVEEIAADGAGKAVSSEAGSPLPRRKGTITSQTGPTPPRGASIILRPTGTNRDIILGRFTVLQSGRGRDALDEIIGTMGPFIRHEGEAGTNGGDIILEAPLGTIRLPLNRRRGDPALFGLGNGGHGADVTVDRMAFDTEETSITIVGGPGGDSGRLIFDAFTVEGVPDPGDEVFREATLLEGDTRAEEAGRGGEGGDVEWWNNLGGPSGDDLMPDKTYPLREIVVRGGVGGDGPLFGGKGGKAFYAGQRVINKIGDPVASVEARGGDGGDVFSSPVPVFIALGGEGGEFVVWGNAGWNGGTAEDGTVYADGADAGDVLGEGGHGGSVLEGTLFVEAFGGEGGNAENARFRDGDDFMPVPGNGAVSAHGGNGLDACEDGCPGGRGGDGGRVSAFGGDGGNVPEGGVSGDGGDAWVVMRMTPGAGGDGNPSGAGGCPQERIVRPGASGIGGVSGDPGEYLGQGFGDQEDCAEDGELCGEDGECIEVLEPVDQIDIDLCGPAGGSPLVGATYAATYKLTSTGQDASGNVFTNINELAETGVWTCDPGGFPCFWRVFGISSLTNADGETVDRVFEGDNRNPAGIGIGGNRNSAAWMARPRCEGGRLIWAIGGNVGWTVGFLGPGTGVLTTEVSFMGCSSVVGMLSCRSSADYVCEDNATMVLVNREPCE